MKILDIFKDKDNQKDAKIRIELADSYATMVNTIAWSDMEIFLNGLFTQSINDQDQIQIGNFGIAEAAEGRGIRKAIEKIRKHISFYVRDGGE